MSALVDSNTLIYYLNAALSQGAREELERHVRAGAHISVITRIEILGWPRQTDPALGKARGLLSLLTEHPLTEAIADLCISFRQARRLKTPDAIIAATAVHLGFPLITRNVDDFRQIPGLQLRNPFDSTFSR